MLKFPLKKLTFRQLFEYASSLAGSCGSPVNNPKKPFRRPSITNGATANRKVAIFKSLAFRFIIHYLTFHQNICPIIAQFIS